MAAGRALPIANAKLLRVVRGPASSAEPAYEGVRSYDNDEPGTPGNPEAQTVWSLGADAFVSSSLEKVTSAGGVDYVEVVRVLIPAVCEVQPEDTLVVLRLPERSTRDYRVRQATLNDALELYVCVIEEL